MGEAVAALEDLPPVGDVVGLIVLDETGSVVEEEKVGGVDCVKGGDRDTRQEQATPATVDTGRCERRLTLPGALSQSLTGLGWASFSVH